ncbi:21418_t:CDS:2, partial [Cetraspora pellucida]
MSVCEKKPSDLGSAETVKMIGYPESTISVNRGWLKSGTSRDFPISNAIG